jgi:DnaJ-class molecular chaperone
MIKTCPECLGDGYLPCPTCDGEGSVEEPDTVPPERLEGVQWESYEKHGR